MMLIIADYLPGKGKGISVRGRYPGLSSSLALYDTLRLSNGIIFEVPVYCSTYYLVRLETKTYYLASLETKTYYLASLETKTYYVVSLETKTYYLVSLETKTYYLVSLETNAFSIIVTENISISTLHIVFTHFFRSGGWLKHQKVKLKFQLKLTSSAS